MENGTASLAELRREKRRQKILSNSNDRIKKIVTGGSEESYNGPDIRPLTPEAVRTPEIDGLWEVGKDIFQQREDLSDTTQEELVNAYSGKPTDSLGDSDNIQTEQQSPTVCEKPQARIEESDSFATIRTLLVLLCGIMVRLSFLLSIGEQYVQTIFNPFMTMEIAIIGYQKAVNMDFGADVKGGIWLSTLVLVGIKPEIIASYKTVMGILSAIATDFALYLFGIIITHIIV